MRIARTITAALVAIGVSAVLPETSDAATYQPVQIAGLADVQTVTGQGYVLLSDGTVSRIKDSGAVSPVRGAVSIVTLIGSGTTYGLRSDGKVLAWGYGGDGELGNGHFTNSSKAVFVKGLTNVRQVANYGSTTYALRKDGTIWSWGLGSEGQLGNGTTKNRTAVPVKVTGLTKVKKLFTSGGEYGDDTTAYALRSDGTVWGWGYGTDGQIGVGTRKHHAKPVKIAGLKQVTQITGSYGTSLAVTADGTAWAWGDNGAGNLGDGTTTDRLRPKKIPGLSDVELMSSGMRSSYALLANGQVWSWGSNGTGGLGDGTDTSRSTPAQIMGIPAAESISATTYSASMVGQDGSLWFWGDSGDEFTDFDPSSLSPISLGVTGVKDIAEPWALTTNGAVWRWQAPSA
jgi:alpha-tubulin suppressor-like RCC1 family protein